MGGVIDWDVQPSGLRSGRVWACIVSTWLQVQYLQSQWLRSRAHGRCYLLLRMVKQYVLTSCGEEGSDEDSPIGAGFGERGLRRR